MQEVAEALEAVVGVGAGASEVAGVALRSLAVAVVEAGVVVMAAGAVGGEVVAEAGVA